MNILLTGATGFVGHALYRELRFRQANVTCVFRKHPDGSKRPTAQFGDANQYVVAHIDKTTHWIPCLQNIDQVVHLAGLAHVNLRGNSPFRDHRFFGVNHEGTRHLAVQAARQGVKRFVFMSSILVNGSASALGPFCETGPANPQNAYAASKYEAEKSLGKIGTETGMDVVILRPPLVYGPGVKANFLKLLDLVYAGIPMPVKAVSNKRSFIGLKNLVDAVCLCLAHEKAGNQTFVVSDTQDLSTPQLITMIADAMNRPRRLFSVPETLMKTGLSVMGQQKMYDRLWGTLQVDSSKIQNQLGWTPPVPVKQGIEETVGWYLKNRRQHRRPKA
jgi:nucleoside-diphosphate-sugar epimerase